MCGRVRLSSDASEIKLVFGIPPGWPIPNFPPSWNVAPTDTLPVVCFNPKAEQRSLDMLRWGLILYCAKEMNVGFSNINAKARTRSYLDRVQPVRHVPTASVMSI